MVMGVLLTGCADRVTNINTSIHNATIHSISLLLYKYKSGVVKPEDTIKLTAFSSLESERVI